MSRFEPADTLEDEPISLHRKGLSMSAFRLAILGAVLCLAACGGADRATISPEHPGRAEIVRFVDAAADLIEKQGAGCFDALREKNSPWYQGDLYAFVWTLDGTRVCYPPDPKGEDVRVDDLKDAKGKPIGQWFIETAESQEGKGWVYYEWPRPGGLFPALKLSYIERAQAPDGTQYLVGSGDYMNEPDMPLVEAIVDKAAARLQADGEKAFAAFRNEAGPFVFGDAYIFVYNPEGVCVFNYATPRIEGKNLWDYRDPKGFHLIREFFKQTEDDKPALVSYAWPKPGASALSRKVAYVRRVETPDGQLLVGAGVYKD